jgi:hypothetical protein
MFEPIVWYASAVAGAIYLLSPVVARSTLRFASRCQLAPISLEQLPEEIAAEFRRRTSEFALLGFAPVGCFDCGALASDTRSFVAYFCNHTTSEFANISAMNTTNGPACYFEFSSRFPDGRSIETNNNAVLPLLPGNPAISVFRFAAMWEPRALLHIHRQLAEKYAPGLCALGEPRDAEIQRYARMIENSGPRQTRDGYMKLDANGDGYRLTWKGAVRIAWLSLWPVTFIRKMIHHHATQSELRSLETRPEAALQKA